ncbi:protein MAIN-LIKE 1-like [Amaranthus tricolor]|uniref:protein MAIN-LIKE 1-like n=1 Tax=Amaranthus tricolor TaxID=29722 RepID=UPI0025862A04|nr:protein MAIN-LIKE 1-like [Amaranthus tricolor]
MAGNQGKGKGFFRGLLSGNRSRPTLLRGDPHERGVTGSARRARQEQAAIHSQAQRSSTLEQVRSRFERQSSLHSHTVGSGDDDTDYDESLSREESLGQDESACHPIDWTIVRGHAVKFKIRGQGSSGTSDQAGVSQAEDAAPRGRRRSQSADTDWLITSAQPGGPVDTTLIPSYGGHVAKAIFEGSERTPPILECRARKKTLDLIIRLQDMSDELYRVLPGTPLGRLPYIMHQHIDSALITTFVERWQPDTNTFHMPWGEMTIMLHDVQRILGIGIDGSLPVQPFDNEWQLGLAGLFGMPLSELRAKGHFTSGSINVGALLQLCHRSQSMDTQRTAYYMAIVGSTLLVDKTRVGMRPHPVVTVTADQADIAWAFRPHPRQADMPNKTMAEMWSPPKPIRELSRLIDCRSILDAMTEAQVEWTPYLTYDRSLLNEHPRTSYIGGITCFDIVEVYLPERTVRQLGFAQEIPPAPLRPTQALRPAQGSYSVTFASSCMFTEMWSRFPYCARVVEQALHRASVPSEAAPDYVDWFRVSSHCFLIPGEGPAAAFGAADNRVEYFAAEFPT